MKHTSMDSIDYDADFTNHDNVDGNHGYGPSVQIHDLDDNDNDGISTPMSDDNNNNNTPISISGNIVGGGMILTPDAIIPERLPINERTDSVDSLDPDFVLEPAYFENSEVYSMSRDDSYSVTRDSIPPPMPNGVSIPMDTNKSNYYNPDHNSHLTVDLARNSQLKNFNSLNSINSVNSVQSVASTVLSDNSSVNSLTETHSQFGVSKDMDFGGSTQWTMPGVSIDHTASMQMLQSMQNIKPKTIKKINDNNNNNNNNNKKIGKSVQYEPMIDATSSKIGKSVQYEAMIDTTSSKIGKSVQYQGVNEMKMNIGKSVQYDKTINNINSMNSTNSTKSIASSMGGEQFIMWQMHGRKLKNMSHESLLKWLESAGFDDETLTHFRKKKIDGKKLWQNIRNASMFLYNVGVVRPTLRDAIVQNIYLELLPKTPGFDERHMSDFKRLQLIADGPISTIYKAQIQKEKLKLRESTVIIKGYHFTADEVRVGKIIQILVHMVTNIISSRFVKIHGFIRNMMENKQENNNNNTIYQRPMFGIVMEYCDGGSLQSIFKNGQNKAYHFEYNIMDKIGILVEIATAMNELHKMKILHRNLKASNVLISNVDDVKLTDYCLDVTQLTDFTHSLDAKERSIRWMSPELIQTQNYTKKCDIYSFGITMYEILSGNKPYHQYSSNSISSLLRKIISENLRPNIDDLANLPEQLLILMTNCWNENPNQRPDNFDDIIDELDKIKEHLRESCITFDDIYTQSRISRISALQNIKNGGGYNYGKAFQSSPLLTMNDSDNDENNEYNTFDIDTDFEYDDNDADDEKFESLLQPYNSQNKPTHIKDDTALELDKLRNFEPKRRKIHKTKKKRPRKPLPKAPPVSKALPNLHQNTKSIEIKPDVKIKVQLPDKPLPPKPLI